MKKLLFVFVIIGLSHTVSAQDIQEIKNEVGIRINNLSNFGLVYKRSKKPMKYVRHRLGLVDFSYSNHNPIQYYRFGLSYQIGFERRKQLDEKVMFIHGFETGVGFYYSDLYQNGFQQKDASLGFNLGYVLGVMYDISDRFNVSLETIPRINFMTNLDDTYNRTDVNIGFNSEIVGITFALKFDRPKKSKSKN